MRKRSDLDARDKMNKASAISKQMDEIRKGFNEDENRLYAKGVSQAISLHKKLNYTKWEIHNMLMVNHKKRIRGVPGVMGFCDQLYEILLEIKKNKAKEVS